MAEKKFTLRNLDTGRSHEVTGNENTTAAMVWASEKCWFQAGAKMIITYYAPQIAEWLREEEGQR